MNPQNINLNVTFLFSLLGMGIKSKHQFSPFVIFYTKTRHKNVCHNMSVGRVTLSNKQITRWKNPPRYYSCCGSQFWSKFQANQALCTESLLILFCQTVKWFACFLKMCCSFSWTGNDRNFARGLPINPISVLPKFAGGCCVHSLHWIFLIPTLRT